MQITVSPEWMAACGYEPQPRTFNVISIQDFGPGRTMYTVDCDGRAWVVWCARLIFADALRRFAQ